MFEGQRVVAGQAIVSDAIVVPQESDDPLELAVREHARLVYRVAYSVLRNHHDAEDAAQETFLRVLRYRRKLEGVQELRTWLARIAWRVAVRRRPRTETATDAFDEAQIGSSAPVADRAAMATQTSDALEGLIAALPAKLREPLVLSTLEEMSPKDVSEVLGISEAAVRSRVFRARQILRDKLIAMHKAHYGS